MFDFKKHYKILSIYEHIKQILKKTGSYGRCLYNSILLADWGRLNNFDIKITEGYILFNISEYKNILIRHYWCEFLNKIFDFSEDNFNIIKCNSIRYFKNDEYKSKNLKQYKYMKTSKEDEILMKEVYKSYYKKNDYNWIKMMDKFGRTFHKQIINVKY